MSNFFIKNNKTVGNIPGALEFIGNQKVTKTTISVISYNKDVVAEHENINEINFDKTKNSDIHWINVYGLHDIRKINEVKQKFSIENLTTEDILDTGHIPKYEESDNYKTLILKNIKFVKATQEIAVEQISIIIFDNTIICFQEQSTGVFSNLRDRIRYNKGKIRKFKADYLFFSILDVLIDNYLNEIAKIGQVVEISEKQIFEPNKKNIEQNLYKLKTGIVFLRMQINPLKELILKIIKSETTFIEKTSRPYFYDLMEMSTQVNNNIELCNSLIVDQINTYNTLVNNKMNETMKILTVFSSIFIPLTFITGAYGMNFKYMPELAFKYSYPIFWIVSILVVISLILFFRKKKWI